MATQLRQEPQFLYSPAVRVAEGATFGMGSGLAWDAYQRRLYNQQNAIFTRQSAELLQRGLITNEQTRILVDQRNTLVRESRRSLSPFGRLYSEILKPGSNLPDHARLLQMKQSNEAILRSVGKTRIVVNRLNISLGYVGQGAVAINLVLSAVVIVRASSDDRARVATRQGALLAGGTLGGRAGAWAGCAGAALIASPSLVLPVVGEIGTGGACVIGGIFGGLGGGALGAWLGDHAGQSVYDFVTRLEWRS